MKLKQLAYVSLIGCFAVACSNKENIIDTPTPLSEAQEYVQKFSTFNEVKVNIDSRAQGACYSIFYEYPYGEGGGIIKKPFLVARTPISTTLKVPDDVTTLYIVGEGNLIEKKVGDLDLHCAPAYLALSSSGRSNGYPDDLDEQIQNFFSEGTPSITEEFLTTNLDLRRCYKGNKETALYDSVKVKLTYLGDGGIAIRSNTETATSKLQYPVFGKVWIYTYPANATLDETLIDKVVFYGLENGKLVKLENGDREYILNNTDPECSCEEGIGKGKYIMWNGDAYKNNLHFLPDGNLDRVNSKETPSDVAPVEIKIPVKENGEQLAVGFVYKSNCGDYTPLQRYSTPCLNKFRSNREFYSLTPPHELIYNITSSITHAVIRNFVSKEDPEVSINVLGIENRAYDHPACDFDYNDMEILIEANADFKPCCLATQVEMEDVKCQSGTFAFEDNYPYHGDFDFNDVVVRYLHYDFFNRTDETRNFVKASLYAYGCDFTNEFGFVNGDNYVKFFKDINGYFNVYNKDVDTLNVKIAEGYFGGEGIHPYLKNENTEQIGTPIQEGTYNVDKFPYVLNIADKSYGTIPFRWCMERRRIDQAYQDIESDSWYTNILDNTLIVDR